MAEGGDAARDETSGIREDPVAGISRDNGSVVVSLAGELDLYNAHQVREALLECCAEGPNRLVVDLSGVKFIDSTALGVLIEARMRMENRRAFLLAAPGLETRRALEISGLDATVTTRISYMDDAPSTSYRTRADYKRVVVTVVRNGDSKQLTQDVTYVAPPGGGAYAGQNEGIVLAQVIDSVLNTPVPGATVMLSGGPTPARTDVTDASGSVTFPALLPTTTALNHYDVTVAATTGYTTLREDTPPAMSARSAIVGGQTFQTILRVYKAATIYVGTLNSDGTPYTGAATVTISSTRGAQSFPFSAGQFTLAPPLTLAGELVVPNVQYTARVLAANGASSAETTQLVPNSYPTDLTKTFTLALGAPAAMQTLTVRVANAGGTRIAGASVTVSGGPGSNILLTGTTDASGTAVFSVPSNATPGYTTTAASGLLTGTASGGVTAPTTRTVTVR